MVAAAPVAAAGVDTKHPDFLDREDEWALMRASSRGEKAIKDGTEDYLPMPTGFRAQTDGGAIYYGQYQARAEYPGIVNITERGMVGVITRKEIKIEMPDSMLPLWENCTPDGLPLEGLYRKIVNELLETGRFILLVDAPPAGEATADTLPFIAPYTAETLINWDDGADFFVLDESGLVRTDFMWSDEVRHRVLKLVDGKYIVQVFVELAESTEVQPTARGSEKLTEIPIVVMNAREVTLETDDPPLIAVARAALAMYQLSADYRLQLFMTGQETLFVFNTDAPAYVGASVVVALKSDNSKEAPPDARYVSPTGAGITAHRQAIEDKRAEAAAAGAKLFESEGSSQESGEAKKIRFAAETATLVSIAQSAAAGLEKALRFIARMMGMGEAEIEKIIVTPDLSFLQQVMTPEQARALMDIWSGGAISYETFYENIQRGGIASDERDWEEERKLIDDEGFGAPSSDDELAALEMGGGGDDGSDKFADDPGGLLMMPAEAE